MENNKRRKARKKRLINYNYIALILIGILSFSAMVFMQLKDTLPVSPDLPYLDFKEMLEAGDIEYAKITTGEKVFEITTRNGDTYSVFNPEYEDFKKDLLESGVTIEHQKKTQIDAFVSIASSLPVSVIVILLCFFIVKTISSSTVNTLYKMNEKPTNVTFDDIAGLSSVKKEVQFAVTQLRETKKLKSLGARPCKGIILEGPPGVGKTLIAKAIAGEAQVPFISCSGSDFIEMFAGLGAARVRKLWDLAELNAPCVVFIDEIDAIGKRRHGGGEYSNEANQTLNELLSKMDGLTTESGILLIGATNMIDALDSALMRPGRFDKHIHIAAPRTKEDRDEIIKVHLRNKKTAPDFDIETISKLMNGLSGAEIEASLNEAVFLSLQDGSDGVINTEYIDKAVTKQLIQGVESRRENEHDLEVASAHEAGHAIAMKAVGRSVLKITVTPYTNGVGGYTMVDIDTMSNTFRTAEDLVNDIKVLLAGRKAEYMVFGASSIGCSEDLQKATAIAYSIINYYGMVEDRLVVPEAIDGEHSDNIESVNDLLLAIDEQVEDMLSDNQQELIYLTKRLIENKVVYNYG